MEVAEMLRQVGSVPDRSDQRVGKMQIVHRIKATPEGLNWETRQLGRRLEDRAQALYNRTISHRIIR